MFITGIDKTDVLLTGKPDPKKASFSMFFWGKILLSAKHFKGSNFPVSKTPLLSMPVYYIYIKKLTNSYYKN